MSIWLIPFLIVLSLSFTFALRSMKRRLARDLENRSSIEDGIFLEIKVPKENERGPLAAEMMFSTLHGLLAEEEAGKACHLSFEIAASNKGIHFYIFVPANHRDFVEGQVYAQYPEAEIYPVDDYSFKIDEGSQIAATELVLAREYYFPTKVFPDFEVDPLAAITSSVEDLAPGEQAWLQIIIRPLPDIWQKPGYDYIERLRLGIPPGQPLMLSLMNGLLTAFLSIFRTVVSGIIIGPSAYVSSAKPAYPLRPEKLSLTPEQQDEIKAIQSKLIQMGFETAIRAVGVGSEEETAIRRVNSLVASLKQFTLVGLNGFERSSYVKDAESVLLAYQSREQPHERENLFVLNVTELASIYHLPNISVATPNIAWTKSKKIEPPLDLPVDAPNRFAKTLFRDREVSFGIRREDRRRHVYVIGKTGTGKTTLLRNMVIQDIRNGEGLAVFDPHGELIDHVLNYIPNERVEDIVIVNPGDYDYPVAINVLELFDPDQRGLVASSLVEVLKGRFEFSWGPRLEHLVRNIFLSLLEVPGTTLLGATRILVDRAYEQYIVHLLEDDVIKKFWEQEFREMRSNPRLYTEAIAPVQNRLGPFLATPIIRNIVGHAKSTIKLDEIMNTGKILLVNLAKGKIGEDNMAILGSMLISRLAFAGFTRVNIPEEERRDFFVYVDEFQNFATIAFATILSEARKYRLNLILAHQYIAQLPEEVRDSIFGNVGSMISFTLGQPDAFVVQREFEPVFDANDMINLENWQIYVKLMIDLAQARPFSATTLPPLTGETGNRELVIARSREKFSRDRQEVEERIRRWNNKKFMPSMDDDEIKRLREAMRRRSAIAPELKGEIKIELDGHPTAG